jgi:shikimate kinase
MRVFLTGVSCVGKTAIGSKLAALLGVPFFDLDREVEAHFQSSIARLQRKYRTMNPYRGKASRVLKAILARPEAQDCVIALPPSGLMVPYWNVVKEARATVVVVKDDPINILKRIVFFDDESRPIQNELTEAELEYYLDEIKKDVRYFGRSYAKANVDVDIKGLPPGDAAKKIRDALDSHPQRNVMKPDQQDV